MDYKINNGIWGAMFGVPCIVADNFLKLASGNQIKVLLYLLRNSGQRFSDDEIAANTGISPQEASEAVLFWEQANVLLPNNSQSVPAAQAGFIMPLSSHPTNTIQPKANFVPEKIKPTERKKQNYTPSEIKEFMENSADIKELFTISELKLGNLNYTQQNSLIYMYSFLGLKKEVIITLITYCVSIDKTSPNYIEKIAFSWAENEINTLDAANEEIERMFQSKELEQKIKKAFCMNRNITSDEKKIIESWKKNNYSFDLIYYAYEITLENINTISFKYTNSVLENWKTDGIISVSDAKNVQSEKNESKKKKSNIKKSSDDNFDVEKYKIFINNI